MKKIFSPVTIQPCCYYCFNNLSLPFNHIFANKINSKIKSHTFLHSLVVFVYTFHILYTISNLSSQNALLFYLIRYFKILKLFKIVDN